MLQAFSKRFYDYPGSTLGQRLSLNTIDKPSSVRIKLALLSCGLGRVYRGFEVSTARWYEALSMRHELDVRLYAGGMHTGAKEIVNIPRDWVLKYLLAPLTILNRRATWEFAYGVEQVSFAIAMLSELLAWRPHVIWTKEAPLAHVLLFFRDYFNLPFKILFANGGGFKPQTYGCFDYIQQLQKDSIDEALTFGITPDKMCLLPNFMPYVEPTLNREEARKKFGFKTHHWVISCVAAWNCHHKRINYLIEELATIRDDNTQLLLIGQPEPDTSYLKQLAQDKLGPCVHWHTLPTKEIANALQASDCFVLPSVEELFGSAALEAVMAGLPTICHPNGGTRQIADLGFESTDLSSTHSLAKKIKEIRDNPPSHEQLNMLATQVRKKFSCNDLTTDFLQMLKQTIEQ